jgi:hypothetical protein
MRFVINLVEGGDQHDDIAEEHHGLRIDKTRRKLTICGLIAMLARGVQVPER